MKKRKLLFTAFGLLGAGAIFGLAACSGNMPEVVPPEVEELTDQEKMIDALLSIRNFDATLDMDIIHKEDTYTVDGTFKASMNSLEDVKFSAELDVDLSIDKFKANATYIDETVFLSLNNKRLKMYSDDLGDIIDVFTMEVDPLEEEEESSTTSLTSLHLKEIVSHISTMTAVKTETGFTYSLETVKDQPNLILTSDANYKLTSMAMTGIDINDFLVSFKLDITHVDKDDTDRIVSPEAEETPYINVTNYIGTMKQVKKLISKPVFGLNYDLSLVHERIYLGKTTGFASVDLDKNEANIDGTIYIDDPTTLDIKDDYNTTYNAQYFDETIYLNYSDMYLLKYSNQGLADLFDVLGDEEVFGVSIFDLLFGASDKVYPILDILQDGTYKELYSFVNEVTLTESYFELVIDNTLDGGRGEGTLRALIDKNNGITKLEIENLDINGYVVDGSLSLDEYKPFEKVDTTKFDSLNNLDGLLKGLGKIYRGTSLGLGVDATVINGENKTLTIKADGQVNLRDATVEQKITDLAKITSLDLALKANVTDFNENKHEIILETYKDAEAKDYLCASYNATEDASKAVKVKAEYNSIADIYNVVMDYLARNSNPTSSESKLPIIGDASIKTIEKMIAGDAFAILRDEIIKSINVDHLDEEKDLFKLVIEKDALNLGKDLSVNILVDHDSITTLDLDTKYDQYEIALSLSFKDYDSTVSYLTNKDSIRNISDVSYITNYLTDKPLKEKFIVLDQIMNIVNSKELGLSIAFDVSKDGSKLLALKDGSANLKLADNADLNDILNYLDLVLDGTLVNKDDTKSLPFEIALQNKVASLSLKDGKIALKSDVSNLNAVIQEISELLNTEPIEGLTNNTNEALFPILDLISQKDYAAILDLYEGSSISDGVLHITLGNGIFNKGDTSSFIINIKTEENGIDYIEVKGLNYAGYSLNLKLGLEEYVHKDVNVSTYSDIGELLGIVEQVKDIIVNKKAAGQIDVTYGEYKVKGTIQADLANNLYDLDLDVTAGNNEYQLYLENDNANYYLVLMTNNDELRVKVASTNVDRIIESISKMMNDEESVISNIIKSFIGGNEETSSETTIIDYLFGDYVRSIALLSNNTTLDVTLNGEAFGLTDDIYATMKLKEGKFDSLNVKLTYNTDKIDATLSIKDYDVSYHAVTPAMKSKGVWISKATLEPTTDSIADVFEYVEKIDKSKQDAIVNQFKKLTSEQKTNLGIALSAYQNNELLASTNLLANIDVKGGKCDINGYILVPVSGSEDFKKDIRLTFIDNELFLKYGDNVKVSLATNEISSLVSTLMQLLPVNNEAITNTTENVLPVLDLLSSGKYLSLLQYYKGVKVEGDTISVLLDNTLIGGTGYATISVTIGDNGISTIAITNASYRDYALDIKLDLSDYTEIADIDKTTYSSLGNLADLINNANNLYQSKKYAANLDLEFINQNSQKLTVNGDLQLDLNNISGGANLLVKDFNGNNHAIKLESFLENEDSRIYANYQYNETEAVKVHASYQSLKDIFENVMKYMNGGEESGQQTSLLETIAGFLGGAEGTTLEKLIKGEYLALITDDSFKSFSIDSEGTYHFVINKQLLGSDEDITIDIGTDIKDEKQVLKSLSIAGAYNSYSLKATLTINEFLNGPLGYITEKDSYTNVDKVSDLIDAIMTRTEDDGTLTLLKQITSLLENKEIGLTINASLKQGNDILFNIKDGKVNAKIADAPAYSEASTYAVGDYVTYEEKAYACKTAVTTSEPFDANKWQEVSLVDRANATISAILSDTDISTATDYNEATVYEKDALVNYDGKVYKCKANMESAAGTFNAEKWQVVALPFKFGYTDIDAVKMLYLRLNDAVKIKCEKDSIFAILDALQGLTGGDESAEQSSLSITIPAIEYFRNGEYQHLLQAIKGFDISGETMNQISLVLSNSLFTTGEESTCSLVITLDEDGIDSITLNNVKYQSYTLDFDLNLTDYVSTDVPSSSELNTYVNASILKDVAEQVKDITTKKQGRFSLSGEYGDFDFVADVQGDLNGESPLYYADITLNRYSNEEALAYSNEATYALNDLVKYNGRVYKCISAIASSEAWNEEHWEVVRDTYSLKVTGSGENLYINYGNEELKAFINYEGVNNLIAKIKDLLGVDFSSLTGGESNEQSTSSLNIKDLIFGDLIKELSYNEVSKTMTLVADGSSFKLGDNVRLDISFDSENKLSRVDANLSFNDEPAHLRASTKEYQSNNYRPANINSYYDISFIASEDVLDYLFMKKQDTNKLVVLEQVLDLLNKKETGLSINAAISVNNEVKYGIEGNANLKLKDNELEFIDNLDIDLSGLLTNGKTDAERKTAAILLALTNGEVSLKFKDLLKLKVDYDNLTTIVSKVMSLINKNKEEKPETTDSFLPVLDLLADKNYQTILESVKGLEVRGDELVLIMDNALFDKEATNNFEVALTINDTKGIASLDVNDLKYGEYGLETTIGLTNYSDTVISGLVTTDYIPLDNADKVIDQVKEIMDSKQARFTLEGTYGDLEVIADVQGDLSGESPLYYADLTLNRYSSEEAAAYSDATAYALNALVKYNGRVYKCINAIESPETWTATHWEVVRDTYSLKLTGNGKNLYINYGEDKLKAYLDYDAVNNIIDKVKAILGLTETNVNPEPTDEPAFDINDLLFGDLLKQVTFVKDPTNGNRLSVRVDGNSWNLGDNVDVAVQFSPAHKIVSTDASLVLNEEALNATIALTNYNTSKAYQVNNPEKYYDLSFIADQDVLNLLLTEDDEHNLIVVNQVLDLLSKKETGISLNATITKGEETILALEDGTINLKLNEDELKDFIHNLDVDLTATLTNGKAGEAKKIASLLLALKNGEVAFNFRDLIKLSVKYDNLTNIVQKAMTLFTESESTAAPSEALFPIMDLLEAKNYQAILESIKGLAAVDGKLVLSIDNALLDKDATNNFAISLDIDKVDGIKTLSLSDLKYGEYGLSASLGLKNRTDNPIDTSSYIPVDNADKLIDQVKDILTNRSLALDVTMTFNGYNVIGTVKADLINEVDFGEEGKKNVPLIGLDLTITKTEAGVEHTHYIKIENGNDRCYVDYTHKQDDGVNVKTTGTKVFVNELSVLDIASTIKNLLGDNKSIVYNYLPEFVSSFFQNGEQEQEQQTTINILDYLFEDYLKTALSYDSSTNSITAKINKTAINNLYDDVTIGLGFSTTSHKLIALGALTNLKDTGLATASIEISDYDNYQCFTNAERAAITNDLTSINTAVTYLAALTPETQNAIITQIQDLTTKLEAGLSYEVKVSKEKGGASAIEIVEGNLDASLANLDFSHLDSMKIAVSGKIKRPLQNSDTLYCPFDIRLVGGSAYVSFQHGNTNPIKAQYDLSKLSELKTLLYQQAETNPALAKLLENLFPDNSENASPLSKALSDGDLLSLVKYFKGCYVENNILYLSMDGAMIGSKDASINIGFDTNTNGIKSIYLTDFYAMGNYISGQLTFKSTGYVEPTVPDDVANYTNLGRVNDIAKDLIKLFGEEYQKVAYYLSGHFGDMLIDATTQFELNSTKAVKDKTDGNKSKNMPVNDGSINIVISSGKKTHYIDADITAVLYDLNDTTYRTNKLRIQEIEEELNGIPEEEWPTDLATELASKKAENQTIEDNAAVNSNITFAYSDSTSTYDSEGKATAHGAKPAASKMMYGTLTLGTVFDVIGLVREVMSGDNARFANIMEIFSTEGPQTIFSRILSGDIEAFIDNKIIEELSFINNTYTLKVNGDIFKVEEEDEVEDFTIKLGTELKSGSTTDYRVNLLSVKGNYQGTDIDLALEAEDWNDSYSKVDTSGKTVYEFSELKDLVEHLLGTAQLNDFVFTGLMNLNILNNAFGSDDGYIDVNARVHLENDPFGYENTYGLISFTNIKSVRGGFLGALNFSEDSWDTGSRTFNIYIENKVIYDDLPDGEYAKDKDGEYIVDEDGNKLTYVPRLDEKGSVVRDANVCMEVTYKNGNIQSSKRTTRSLNEFLSNIAYYLINYGIGVKKECAGQATNMWSNGDASTHVPTYSTVLQAYSYTDAETKWQATIDVADLLDNNLLGPATITLSGNDYKNADNETIKLLDYLEASLNLKVIGINIGTVALGISLSYPATISEDFIASVDTYVQANKHRVGEYTNVTKEQGRNEGLQYIAVDNE